MSFQENNQSSSSRAEKAFREAFERLKTGKTICLDKGSLVSQNNVAKEAGCDPSALRKSRYPSLVNEIQRWLKEQPRNVRASLHQSELSKRSQNRSLRAQIQELKVQRDLAASLLIEADAKILELTLENSRLKKLLPTPNISPLKKK